MRVYLTSRNRLFFDSIQSEEIEECTICEEIVTEKVFDGYTQICTSCGGDSFYTFKEYKQ